MSNLSKKERDKLPDSAFCYVSGKGDKKVRLFPILDASDVTSAARLIGKSPDPEGTKRCIIGKAKANGWPIPDAWKSETARHSLIDADTAAAIFAAEEFVIKTGTIFRAGDYPDKGIDLTPEDLLAATLDFTPIPVNAGHPLAESPLDGLMGELRAMDLADDGERLIGTAAIPQWLDDLLPPGELPVSMEWDRQTKRPRAISLVLNPRIEGAALLAAFAKRHDTPQGQAVMQSIHDRAAAAGAVCKQGNTARMSSRHEQAAVQAIHDIAVEHGAICSDSSKGGLSMGSAYYSETGTAAAAAPPRRGLMSLMSWFKNAISSLPDDADPREAVAIFGGSISGQTQTPAQATPQAQGTSGETPSTPGAQANFAADKSVREQQLETELQRERSKGILRDATAFADLMIAQERAFPMEKEEIISGFARAATDDVTFGVATFANGKQELRVDQFKRQYDVRPPHQLTKEQLGPELARVLFSQQTTPTAADKDRPLTPEELDNLLSQTSLGASILRDRQNGAAARR